MKEKIIKILLLIFCLYSLFFVIGSILSPILAHIHQYDLSGKLTATYMFSCHQRPERSFWILGYPVALCCRCLGFYIGVSISSFVALIKKWRMPIKYFVLLFIICLIDVLLNFIFDINTHNFIRFTIGIIMGILFSSLICFGFGYRKGEKNNVY